MDTENDRKYEERKIDDERRVIAMKKRIWNTWRRYYIYLNIENRESDEKR